MLQFFELCRLCAQKKKNKIDLFSTNDEETQLLISKISLCLSLQVTREDMLPKMICLDCQRSIEQFNMFRLKCHKAEERLNKMLSLHKLVVTRIKQEHLETDLHESISIQTKVDSPKRNDLVQCLNLKPVKNVKCEIDETGNEIESASRNESANSDLIQIISDEIVNQHNFEDIKQPHIEIISENYAEFKDRDFNERDLVCDIKTIRLDAAAEENDDLNDHAEDIQDAEVLDKTINPANFIEVKMQVIDNENEQMKTKLKKRKLTAIKSSKIAVPKTNNTNNTAGSKSVKKKSRKSRHLVESDTEIDEKYLLLGENETCDIDVEEMEAVIKKKKDPSARFNCDKCGKSFKGFKCLRKHKEVHNTEPDIFYCEFCSREDNNVRFCSLKSLKNHMYSKHLARGKFPCPICNRILPSQGQLNAHHKKVHDNSGATCQICRKVFKNKTRLTDHLKVHQEGRPYVCDQCGQSFKWNNGLKVHIQSHKQEKNFLCSECGKKFAAKKNLIEHLNIHTGKRPHVCEHCNASFVQLSAYSKHLFVHNENLKIHKCDKCDKSFSHGYMLKQHMLQHSRLRPHECLVCHNFFKTQSDLCSHSKIHQEKQHECNICGRKFSRSKTLRDHMVRHTGIKHICPAPNCGKSYTQRFPLTKHFNKHHPNLVIINRLGGKKAHLSNKFGNQENFSNSDFIRYDFRYKNELIVD